MMALKETQNTCDIYRRAIDDLIARGDSVAIAEFIKVWYSRCDFGKSFDGQAIKSLGVRENGTVWIQTSRGVVEFCQDKHRWRLVTSQHEDGQADQCIYPMARIAEVTQVPFAYLCGIRDAVAIIERQRRSELGDLVRDLSRKERELSESVSKKKIALDAVFVSLEANGTKRRLLEKKYPDAPNGTFTWGQMRKNFRNTPGIYFAWDGGKIVYVGATQTGMHSRLASGHNSISRDERMSFVELPSSEVFFAEHYYILKYVPERNACVSEALGKRKAASRGKRREGTQPDSVVCVGHDAG
jgi:hypothetical protein